MIETHNKLLSLLKDKVSNLKEELVEAEKLLKFVEEIKK